MNVTVTKEGNVATLKIGATAAEVAKSYKQAVSKVANQANIPGFRKGKAPRMILEQRLGKEAIKAEAFEILANQVYGEALDQEKLVPVADPKLVDSKFEEGQDAEFTLTVVTKPEPELGEYKGLHVDKKAVEITDEQVDKAVDELRNRHAKMVNADDDAVIEKGDFAMIDFAGTVDGEPFDGGEGKSYPLEVGSGSFIPGFEDQLIGLKKGDDTDVDVTFPEDYFVKELAGKQAIFKVTIQGIRHKELPELTDEYVAANSEYKTVAEIKEAYRKRMEENATRNADTEYEAALVDTAVANAKFEVPEEMVEQRIDTLVEEIRLNLAARKVKLEDYLQYTGMDMAQLREAQKERAAEGVRTDLVLDAIAKAENIQVTMEDIDAEIASIANEHGAKVEDVKQIISANRNMGLLLANILRRKAAHVIIDSAK